MAKNEHICRCGKTILYEGIHLPDPDGFWTCYLCPSREGDRRYGLGHIVLVFSSGEWKREDNGGPPPRMPQAF